MKSRILFLLILFITVTAFTSYTKKEVKVSYPKTTFNLGKLKSNEAKKEIKVVFKNSGNEDLYIRRATAACTCTSVDYDLNPIPPGKMGSVKVMVDFCLFRGKITKQVKILTTADDKPKIITVTADIVP